MKNKCLAVLVFSTLSTGAFAAKFSTIKTMTNAKLNAFAKAVAATDTDLYGDCSSLFRLKVTKDAAEKNFNTIKQMHYKYQGMNSAEENDAPAIVTTKNTFEIMKHTLAHGEPDNFEDSLDHKEEVDRFKKDVKDTANALYEATQKFTDTNIEMYEAIHSDEDGGWAVLSVYDIKNQEIITLRSGYCGT